MLTKKQRTLDEYKAAGALMRLYMRVATKAHVAVSNVLPVKESDKLQKAFNIISEVCSKAEDNMYRDFPELGKEYKHVFYGATDIQSRDSLDAEMIALARKAADELFERDKRKAED